MKLIMCIGLPASGKSTWAAEQAAERDAALKCGAAYLCSEIVVVNKDDIRAELIKGGWLWSPEKEQEVTNIRDTRIIAALAAGKDVISSDTNFARKHKVRLQELARQFGGEFEVKRFDTPVEECIRRDSLREAGVGEKVILAMAAQYLQYSRKLVDYQVEPVTLDATLPQAIICDLDGTLSLFKEKGHRGPYDATKCDEDELNSPVATLIGHYDALNYHILLVSGREDLFREPTVKFLEKHGIPYDVLFMRQAHDTRKDWLVKYELFNTNIRGKFNVEFVLDDRDQVVAMWRKLGLTCFQVAEGDF